MISTSIKYATATHLMVVGKFAKKKHATYFSQIVPKKFHK